MLELKGARRPLERSDGAFTRLPPMEQDEDGEPEEEAIVEALRWKR